MKLRYGTPEEAGMSPDRVWRAAALCEGWVRDGITPAIQAVVARRGVIVLHEAFGRLRPESDAPPLQRDSLFPLASLTKPITATAAMMLVEDGLLGLNRPVQDYLPEFVGEGKEQVMVHHLLTHTSGLDDEHMLSHVAGKLGVTVEDAAGALFSVGLEEFLRPRYDAPLWKPPGTEMAYCNAGYEFLGDIVRRVSGRQLEEFAEERIFRPLEMRDSSYVVPEAIAHRIVMRPADAFLAVLNTRSMQQTPWACGGVYATALDTAVFGQMILNCGSYGDVRVLSPATVAEMMRNQIPGIGAHYHGEYFPEASWGYGWDVLQDKKGLREGSLRSPACVLHGGAGGTYVWIDPGYDLVGVYFSVQTYPVPRPESPLWRGDYFSNAVMAAVTDA